MNSLAHNIKSFKPAITLTTLVSRRSLSVIRTLSLLILIALLLGTPALHYFVTTEYTPLLIGVGLIILGLWLDQILIYAYHNSFYYRGLNSILGLEASYPNGATYEVAEAVLKKEADLAYAFCTSTFGANILLRAGLQETQVSEYLASSRRKISADEVTLPEEEIFSLIGLGKYILTHDLSFKHLLKEAGVPEEHYLGALRFVITTYHQVKRQERWWSKDNLSQTQAMGRELGYGQAYLLERYARDIRTSAVFSTLSANHDYAQEKIVEIETTLARAKAANVLVVGEAGVGKMDLLMEVRRRMSLGQSIDAISGMQVLVLDTDRLFAHHHDKADFETTLLNMFDEATLAGNTIVVIENISTFIKEAAALEVHIPELLDEYLALPDIKIIATDTPGAYHNYLEPLGAFTRRFNEVLVESPDLQATTRVLQNIALQHETKYGIIFTYAALQAVTVAADRYLVSGVMPDKAITLLLDVASKAGEQDEVMVTEDFVYQLVSDQTNVPAGPIKDEERDLLLHLSDKLHQQVIGQNAAVDAIAKTMRRVRAGIQASDRPLGSFLFLGPTGVGKTETAKALAAVFFGGEDKMQRLDMSEFSGTDALTKLIGDGHEAGTLPNLLREHPYCVLLLDEFEKARAEVHDIFLQALDEGIFTDSRGTQVNVRNTIIIATSNAGSRLILDTVQQRKDLSHLSAEIINHIIQAGAFKPELINRFDSTIIFEPLNENEQVEVARLMLNELYERMTERGFELTVSDELIHKLVMIGYDPEFGARPLRRIIQDVVEEKIAHKIIADEVHKGDKITLDVSDFTNKELGA